MKKGIIIGIAIIIIGVIAIGVSQSTVDDTSQSTVDDATEVIIDESVNNEPKQFTVDLAESVGFLDP